MIHSIIKSLLIALILFTPLAFGSMEVWAFSLMELSILFIIILWAIQSSLTPSPEGSENLTPPSEKKGHFSSLQFEIRNLKFAIPFVLLALFLLLILFQIVPLPSGLMKTLSPKTFALRQSLSISSVDLPALSIQPSASNLEPSALSLEPRALRFPLSFFPFLTRIEFFKWFALAGLFVFLLGWKPLERSDRTRKQLLMAVMTAGVLESLYGMFEFFSGHRYILNVAAEPLVSAVTGTFINRNYFSGYLLMVIPLSVGFLFSREATRAGRYLGWRDKVSSLDGKTVLIGFGVVMMILGLLFSASRMGILSLLLSFSLISLFFRSRRGKERFSGLSLLILGLAILWAGWIGLDAVISRFFSMSESLQDRGKIWADTFRIFKDFPLFGSGLGTFIQVFPMVRSFHIVGLVTHAENDFLQLLVEVGIFGTGLLVILFFFLLWKVLSGIRALSDGDPGRYIALGGLVGILALMVHSLVERNIQVPANAFLYTLIFAVVLRIASVTKKEKIEADQRRKSPNDSVTE